MNSSGEETRFKEFLESKSLKFTSERKLILEQAFRMHDHFEADEIEAGLKARGSRVSRASIYRTLPLLVGSGLLREVDLQEKHSHYEHVFGHKHHDHLICTECGRAIEFVSDEIEELQSRICETYGFDSTSHKLVIIGACRKCREVRT